MIYTMIAFCFFILEFIFLFKMSKKLATSYITNDYGGFELSIAAIFTVLMLIFLYGFK